MNPLSMNTTLSALHAAARSAGAGEAGDVTVAGAAGSGEDFAAALKGALDAVSARQDHAAQLAKGFELGDGTDLPEVMINMQKARLAFQTTMQVRNKLVAAYQDIMNMPL